MAIINTSKLDTFDTWRVKTNTTAAELGDNALLGGNPTLTSTTAVGAILEVLIKSETEIGIIGALTTTATTLVGGINEHDAEIGVISTLTTAEKGTLVGSINELDSEIGDLVDLETSAQGTVVAAINELNSEHGVLSTLTTTEQGTFVGSINEIVQRETDRYDNTLKLDLTDPTVGGSNNSTQTILSNLALPSGKTFTIDGTLDISEGTLTVGGGENAKLNINTTYIGLGDTTSAVAPSGGLIINRGTDFGGAGVEDDVLRPDVRIYWDATDNQWHLKRIVDNGGVEDAITPYILDNTNFADIISGGTQQGITVTYQNESTLDFNVDDFTITLTGDVTGTGTVTNLGNVSIATTVEPNKVALGTDTTGAYVETVNVDATNPGISFSVSAGTGGEKTVISALKVDSTVVRTTGAQSIAGVKTFSDKPVMSSGFTSNADSRVEGVLTVTSDLVLGGNLTISGTTTTVNTETVTIADNIIVLNSDAVGTPTENGGVEVERGDETNTSILWNETDDVWQINDGSTTRTLVGSVVLDDAISASVQVNTTINSNSGYCSDITGVEVGDFIRNCSGLPLNTFVTAITPLTGVSGTITFSQNATAGVNDTSVQFEKAPGLEVDTTGHVVTLQHYTPVTVARDSDNAAGVVIQDLKFDQFGHVITVGTYDLDNRYFTETEADARFLKLTGGTLTGALTATGFTGPLTGNASTATSAGKWTTARTLTLGGDLTGSVSIDGSSAITLSAQVADNSHNHTAANITDFNTQVTGIVSNLFDGGVENGISISYNSSTGKMNADVGDFTLTVNGTVTGSGVVNNLGNTTINTAINGSDPNFIAAVRALMPKIYNVSGNLLFPPS
jgi:hypothetical protein